MARARSLDMMPLERAIADAKLAEQERRQAEVALSRAKAIKAASEKSGTVSNLDLADLRRIVEKNLPDTLNRYAATDPSARDDYDGDTRTTANKMLKSSLADALTAMQAISERSDAGARRALQGEAAVLQTKAETAKVLMSRSAEDAGEAQREDQALKSFGGAVDSAAASVAEPDPGMQAPASAQGRVGPVNKF